MPGRFWEGFPAEGCLGVAFPVLAAGWGFSWELMSTSDTTDFLIFLEISLRDEPAHCKTEDLLSSSPLAYRQEKFDLL